MSDAALLSPRAPVGGTMWTASPARNRRPYRIGSATKLRSGALPLADSKSNFRFTPEG